MTNIAINGFGRIGRAVFKLCLEDKIKVNIVAINDLTDTKTLAHLLQYDSVYGKYEKKVSYTDNSIVVSGKKYMVFAEKEPNQLPWKRLKVSAVLECTGLFRTREQAGMHILAGAKKVIISAPPKGEEEVKSVVLGVNENKLTKADNIMSVASCTTNCLAPITKIMESHFGIKKALMTTIHAYTSSQNIVDGPHKDLRRARACAINIVPTTTGAVKATTEVIPSLNNKFDGMAIRVPIPVGSLVDATYLIKKKTDIDHVNNAFIKESLSPRFKGIVRASTEPLVSSDIVGDKHSSIVDLLSTLVVGGDLVKVIAWYDNEWGYSSRMVDLVKFLKKKKYI